MSNACDCCGRYHGYTVCPYCHGIPMEETRRKLSFPQTQQLYDAAMKRSREIKRESLGDAYVDLEERAETWERIALALVDGLKVEYGWNAPSNSYAYHIYDKDRNLLAIGTTAKQCLLNWAAITKGKL